MKKLFHRKKNSAPSSPEQTPSRSRRPSNANANPSFRTSRYESTTPADLPQTGQFPLKGNSSSVSFHGRRSETYNRGQDPGSIDSVPRPSTSSPYYGSLPAPRVTSASHGNANPEPSSTENTIDYDGVRNHQQKQRAPSNDPSIQAFSNLNLHSPNPRDDPEHYPHRQHQGPETYATNARETGYSSPGYGRRPRGENSSTDVRTAGQIHPAQPYEHVPKQDTSTLSNQQERQGYHDQKVGLSSPRSLDHPIANGGDNTSAMGRTPSIQRKEVPGFSQTPGAAPQQVTSSKKLRDRDRDRHRGNPNSAPQYQYEDDHRPRPQKAAQPHPNFDVTSLRYPQDVRPSTHEVMDRARGNTYDTQVIEKVAPAVVHERLHQDIHHVREEVITREIHEHEIYHRILPVIDVEVLPPRHFLPVEGGGLVEISGKEVPGRGNNWVIAETASKIPSDQAAPKGSRNFSARQFLDKEGDAVEYTTAEGYPRTEQTWVHAPELETGGRNTGQTWPMEFGEETKRTASREHKSSRAPKPKRSRKSMEAQPSTNQQPRTGP
ncbi:MAG: hypothetical protein Q9207_002003 [Kuettlingeria erythrocarpa]